MGLPIGARAAEKGGPQILRGSFAAEPVVVGRQPEKVIVHRQSFHNASGIGFAVTELVFKFLVIELREDQMTARIDLENHAVMTAQNKQVAGVPG